MTKLNLKSVLTVAAITAALTAAVSNHALAKGGGMGGHMGGSMGGHMGGNLGRINTTSLVGSNKVITGTNKVITETNKLTHVGDHDRRHLRFLRYGYVGIDAAPVCFYKWTNIGRVRICPSLDY